MISLRLTEISAVLSGNISGDDLLISSICTDTRNIQKGDLYVALKGENFDGNKFVATAFENGAAAVICEKRTPGKGPQIVVDNTLTALGKLAAYCRSKSTAKIVAITGSNGKTTVKEMVAAILREKGKTVSTQGNFNNEIGLPLSILQLEGDEQFAVLEMGASKIGDIDYLTTIASPDIAIITNVSAAHIEGFGDITSIAKTKGEIFSGLTKNGIAILNIDDPFYDEWANGLSNKQIITFGMSPNADIQIIGKDKQLLQIQTPKNSLNINIALPGEHNIKNALAAVAVTFALGISAEEIKNGLEKVHPVNGRLCFRKGINQSTIIDDSYNANPASLAAGLTVLAEQKNEKWLLFGDMGELGTEAEKFHKEVAINAKKAGVCRLLACGKFGEKVANEFGNGGKYFTDRKSLAAHLKSKLNSNISLLIKGSRFMKLNEIADQLVEVNNSDYLEKI